jgi:ATP-dependent Lhr-like helicase
VWRGVEPIGDRDGRVALYLTDHVSRLWRPPAAAELGERERAIVGHLETHGASFFAAVHEAAGGGYPGETVDALWDLVWKGLLTNDTFHALRAFTRAPARRPRKRERAGAGSPFRSRRVAPPSAEGRWSRLADRVPVPASDTQWSTAMAQQLLARYGVVTREVAAAEGIAGGFGAVYDVLKALEDAGRVRRGYFVGVGATQFALPPALELLRSLREPPDEPETLVLAATDTANPYGTTLKWPAFAEAEAGRAPTRTVGALVVLVNGALAAHLPRGGRQVTVYLPEDEPARSTTGKALARAGRTGARRAPRRIAPRRDQRPGTGGAPDRAVPDRGRLQPVRDGLPDAPPHLRRGFGGQACLKGITSSGRRAPSIARSPGMRSSDSSRYCHR